MLAAAPRSADTSCPHSGLRPSVGGKVTSGLKLEADLYVVNNNKYLSHVVDNIIFRINMPYYPISSLKESLYDHFGISVYFVYIIFI